MSAKKNVYLTEGIVIESLPNTTFRVRLDEGREILAHLAGKMRLHKIKVLPGDRVVVEMPSASDERGRIIYRKK